MARQSRDPGLERAWRERVARWSTSGQSVRAFCQQHGLIETSFYYLKRELRAREAAVTAATVSGSPSHAASPVMAPAKSSPRQWPVVKTSAPVFVPVTVLPGLTLSVEVRCPSGHIVLVSAALHDRPVVWACEPKNWRTTTLQPWKLPSDSTISDRAKRAEIAVFLRALGERLHNVWPPQLAARLDDKPFTVGGATKDRTARYGRAAGVMAKGYKLHAVWACRPLPETWDVTPLNAAEVKVAEEALVPQLQGCGYLLAAGNYESSSLHAAAAQRNYQLVTPCKSPNAGKGHHYQSPFRRRSIELLQRRFGQQLLALRGQIERDFGNAATFAGGLNAPPSWVRTLRRVCLWVWIKLLINAVRILQRHQLAT